MDEERFDQLYNRILDGENWDYSTLDELICLSESGAREKGREEMKKKAIEVYRNLCPSYKLHTRYECGSYSHRMAWKTKVCDMNCEYMKKFMEKI